MPPAAATDATAPDADADARVAAAPDAAAPAAAPTAPAAESTGPTAPVAPPARSPAMPPSGASDGPNADEPPAASPDAPAATAATARDARDTPDATRVPASAEQCAAVLRQHMGPDHPFAVSYSPSDNPKHHNTTVYCELPECRKARPPPPPCANASARFRLWSGLLCYYINNERQTSSAFRTQNKTQKCRSCSVVPVQFLPAAVPKYHQFRLRRAALADVELAHPPNTWDLAAFPRIRTTSTSEPLAPPSRAARSRVAHRSTNTARFR